MQPLLSDKEGISGHGYELYINAKPATLQTIRELIARIDKQAAQLLISVKNLNINTSNQTRYSVDANIKHNNTTLTIGGKAGGGIAFNSSGKSVTQTQRQTPQVRATEGQPALISSGISLPIKSNNWKVVNGHVIENEVTDYRAINSGFYVTAWLNGNRVKLDIQQQQNSPSDGNRIQTSSINTTAASGKLGEWIAIGGVTESSQYSSYEPNPNATHSTNYRDNTIYIKVDTAD